MVCLNFELMADPLSVVWVPEAELVALNPGENYGAKQTLEHLEEWNSTEWGLPPIQF
jgi:pseudouridine-5'-monophosphatase